MITKEFTPFIQAANFGKDTAEVIITANSLLLKFNDELHKAISNGEIDKYNAFHKMETYANMGSYGKAIREIEVIEKLLDKESSDNDVKYWALVLLYNIIDILRPLTKYRSQFKITDKITI